ncbi:hypothetical protein D3C73_1150260 [compost metagenome]
MATVTAFSGPPEGWPAASLLPLFLLLLLHPAIIMNAASMIITKDWVKPLIRFEFLAISNVTLLLLISVI